MLSIGIVGLPNVGKSTLFKALTKKQVDISNYPFCTIEPNIGIVAVPDERLNKLAEVLRPGKKTSTVIEFVDIAGLVKNAHKGEGLGNQFLARIRQTDAILEVARAFEDSKIIHIEGRINPQEDIETIKIELVMKDLESVHKYREELKDKAKSGDDKSIKLEELSRSLKDWLNQGNMAGQIPEPEKYQEIFSQLQLLTIKPVVYILNGGPSLEGIKILAAQPGLKNIIQSDLKLEAEMSELNPDEIAELSLSESALDQLIKICYDVLNLITFYTVAGLKEIRAWTVRKNTPIKEAAGKIHTDFQEKFIKAEVINWERLVNCGSWHDARDKGLLRTEGKEYIMQDGDVIEIKI